MWLWLCLDPVGQGFFGQMAGEAHERLPWQGLPVSPECGTGHAPPEPKIAAARRSWVRELAQEAMAHRPGRHSETRDRL